MIKFWFLTMISYFFFKHSRKKYKVFIRFKVKILLQLPSALEIECGSQYPTNKINMRMKVRHFTFNQRQYQGKIFVLHIPQTLQALFFFLAEL